MKVPRHVLSEAIARRTLDVSDSHELSLQIAAYLLVENRVHELESILRDIMQYRTDHGVLEAEVVTAHELQSHVVHDVEQLLRTAYPNAKDVHISTHKDPSIIGGLRIDMANEQLDLSIAAKLATFKRLAAGEHNL